MNELTGWTFQIARMKLFRSDLELILWHFETNNPCEGEKFIGIFYNIFRGYSIKKTYTSFVSKLSWPTSDETAAKSVLSLQDLFLDLETNFRYKSNSSNLPCLSSGDPWQLIHWKNRCWNEKRYKQISDNYTYKKSTNFSHFRQVHAEEELSWWLPLRVCTALCYVHNVLPSYIWLCKLTLQGS